MSQIFKKLNLDKIIDNKFINELHTNWILQHEAEQVNPDSVKISNDFIRIGIQNGDTIDTAIEKIYKFETLGLKQIDVNKSREHAKRYFKISGYEIVENKDIFKIIENNQRIEKLEKQNDFIENSNKTFQKRYSETNPLNTTQKINEKLSDKLTEEQKNQIINKTKYLSAEFSKNNTEQKVNDINNTKKTVRK